MGYAEKWRLVLIGQTVLSDSSVWLVMRKLSRCSADVRRARDLAPEVKSDSRDVRFVIAKRSPERVSETGLRMEAREKNRWNGSDAAQRSFSLVRFVEGNTALRQLCVFCIPRFFTSRSWPSNLSKSGLCCCKRAQNRFE